MATAHSLEQAARKRFLAHCWKNYQRFCPRCRKRKNYKLATGSRRCAGCGYTYHDFTGRWINQCDLSCRQWLSLLHSFIGDCGVRETSVLVGVSYNTAYKAITTLRQAIAAHALDAEQLEEFLAPAGGGKKVDRHHCRWNGEAGGPVFGVKEVGEYVFVDVMPNLRADDVLHFNLNFMLGTERRGGVVVTDRFQHYSALVCCLGDQEKTTRLRRFVGSQPLNELRGFWRDAARRLSRHRGVTPDRFPLYMKELEFRYNARDRESEEIADILASYLCDFQQAWKE